MKLKNLLIGSILGVCAVLAGAQSIRAAEPVTTISSPVNSSTVNDSSLTVVGTFTTDTDVKSVEAVVCTVDSSNRCVQYVQSATGGLDTKWRSIAATITTTNKRTGTYSVVMSGMASGKYQIAVFAADQITSKGPRTTATVNLSSSVSTSVEPLATIASPVTGSTSSSPTFDISGSFTAATAVKSVNAVICQLNTANKCSSYVQSINGGIASPWRSLVTSLSTADSLSGTYSLSIPNVPAGKYQIAIYVVDQTTDKGPRTYSTLTYNPTTPPPTGTAGYITILWGRTNWQATNNNTCTPVTGARTLLQNADDLKYRGLSGVGGIVINRTDETLRTCMTFTSQPSWADLANLRDNYGWQFISQGMNYEDMTLMTTDEQRYNESIATLPVFEAHGFTRAWGAFAYPNNKQDNAAYSVVNSGFAFGRKYNGGINTPTELSQWPYTMRTTSVNGGRCNNAALPCYNMAVKNDRRSASPVTLASLLSPQQNQWGVVQFYRLVEGKYGKIGNGFSWDCSSSDWRDRWTSQPELYCRESFIYALDNRTTTAESVDPATIAEKWNILPSTR